MHNQRIIITAVLFLTAVFMLSFFGGIKNTDADYPSISSPLRVNPANPRYFTDDTGKAIYLTGSHIWSNLQEYKVSENFQNLDFPAYLNLLESKNHNFIRFWNWESPRATDVPGSIDNYFSSPMPYLRTGPNNAQDGKPKFDLNQFDETYFQRLHDRVEAANNKNIYVSVMLFEGWAVWDKLPTRDVWKYHPFNKLNNIQNIDGDPQNSGEGGDLHTIKSSMANIFQMQKAYIRKVVDTVNEFDNVLYEISNEDNSYSPTYDNGGQKSFAWQEAIVQYIKDYEAGKITGYPTVLKQHPVGISAINNLNNDYLFNSNADWISPRGGEYAVNPPVNSNRVIIADTDHIFGYLVGSNPNIVGWPWKSFLRGHNPILMDWYGDHGSDFGTTSWYSNALQENYRKNMGYTLSYARKINLAAMTPSTSSADCSTTYCLRNPGSEYLVYQPGSSSFSVNLLTGTYNYEWFDPSTGSAAGAGIITITSEENKLFTPPFTTSEAVLHLKVSDPQCSDGIDNDTDGKCDFGGCDDLPRDPGCASADDNNETDFDQNDGLVGHWKLDDLAGSPEIIDSSIYKNNGINHGAVLGIPGRLNTASKFDGGAGTDNYIEIPDPGTDSIYDFKVGDTITLTAWIEPGILLPREGVDAWFPIVGKQDFGFMFSIYPQGTNGLSSVVVFSVMDSAWNFCEFSLGSSATPINKDNLYHIAVTHTFGQGSKIKIYVNSIPQTQNGKWYAPSPKLCNGDITPNTGNKMVYIGADPWGIEHKNSEEWIGMIDDVRIYNKALSQSEIEALYNMTDNPADVNGDGKVNIKDIQEVIRCIINNATCEFPDRSDVNNDERINIKDIQEIIRKIINP